ncbi:MAG: type II toxin-antitoxin system RelE/ParE family toxin [Pseudomonadota bacterium]
MRVNWTARAKARLKSIHHHIEQDNPTAAQAEIEKILRRSWQLAESPDIGHPLMGYASANLREVLVRPYRLIYRREDTHVDIITVLHYRQLLPLDLDPPRR